MAKLDRSGNGFGRIPAGVGRLGRSAGRFVLVRTRVVDRSTHAAKSAGDVLEPVAERAVDKALAGPLPEAVARSLVEHHVLERVVGEVLSSADFQAAVAAALEHEQTSRLVRQLLESPATERLIADALESKLTAQLLRSPELEHVLAQAISSPAVRAALTAQTTTIGDEMVGALRRGTMHADDAVERGPRRFFRRPPRPAPDGPHPAVPYAGAATRGLGLAIDALLAQLVFLTGAAVVALFASLAGGIHPSWLAELISAVGLLVVQVLYFVGFWSIAGRTPGMMLMGLRLYGPGDRGPGIGRSFVRLVGLWLAVAIALLGFLPVLVDDRRRVLQDFLAGTVVAYDERGG